MEIGSAAAFLRVNLSNEIQINTAVGGAETWQSLSSASGNITLSDSVNNSIVMEIVPSGSGYELIADFYDGTTYTEANAIQFTVTGSTGDNLGFARNAVERGQVLEFKAINSPGYLRHSELNTLHRQHFDDKWDFGFARLIAGGSFKEVDFATRVNLPAGSMMGGENLVKPESIVYEATSKTASVTPGDGGLVSTVDLPVDYTDFKYVHVTEYDDASKQWRHTEFPVSILALVTAGDDVRLQGNTTMAWVSATRSLTLSGGALEIFRVSLKD